MSKPSNIDSTWIKFTTTTVLADVGTQAPVTVICNYDINDNLLFTEAFNADGTDYTGNISTLVFPDFFLATTTFTVKIEDSNGDPLTSTGGSLNVNITGGGGGVVGIVNQGTAGAFPWLVTGAVTQSGVWNITSITNPVAVTGAFYPATQPISALSLPLPLGASTEASLLNILTDLAALLTTAAFQARINTLGQKAMAASTPVVIASDQSAIPVTVSSTPLVTFVQTQPPFTDNTSADIWAANPARKSGSYVVNNTSSTFWISVGAVAALSTGAPIYPGQVFDFNSTQELSAIQNSGGPLVLDAFEAT